MTPLLHQLQKHLHRTRALQLAQSAEHAEFLVGHTHVVLVCLTGLVPAAFSDWTQFRLSCEDLLGGGSVAVVDKKRV